MGEVTRAALCSFRSVPFIRRPYVLTLCFLDGEVLRVVTCGGDDGGDDGARACMRACRERACTRARVEVRQCQGREMSSICPFLFRALSFSSPIYSFRLPLFLSLSLSFFFLFTSFSFAILLPLSISLFLSPFVRSFRAAWGVWCNELENQYPSTDKYRPRLATACTPRRKISPQRENGTLSLPP